MPAVLNPFDLSGRVACVTGANAGIGAAIAVALAQAGADVALVGRTAAVETLAKVEACERRAVIIDADLATTGGTHNVIPDAIASLGAVDILVNNAGIIRRADALDVTEGDWDMVVETNLKSAFFLAQSAGRHMLARGRGRIINIASMLTFQGGIRVASYTASKSGIGGITKALANEWGAGGVTVNAIAPGYIATNNTQALQDDKGRNEAIVARIPAARWGEPSDLGGAAVFLASDAAAYVNGHVLVVDGGWLAR